jgi:hypothetical protein
LHFFPQFEPNKPHLLYHGQELVKQKQLEKLNYILVGIMLEEMD